MKKAGSNFSFSWSWLVAAMAGLYLYYLLPITATLFYELYHLTQLGPVYWGYSFFKIAGYYFGAWEYRLLTCVLLFLAIVSIAQLYKRAVNRE